MKLASVVGAIVLLLAPLVLAQSGAPRAWQHRIDVDVALPVPIVELAGTNPFATDVDQPPRLLSSTPPRKLDVHGIATVAAYVGAKGDCLGGVPLELPFPGLTNPILSELDSTRFDPATTADGPVGSWVVLGIGISGRIKESVVAGPTLELPDPELPPEPTTPPDVVPSGLLLRAPYEQQSALTNFASPRRLRVKAPAREAEVPVRAMVHVTVDGRCDRFVPLNLERGLHNWLSAYLASWRLEPARRDGQPRDAWVVFTARAQMKISSLDSTGVSVIRDRSFEPPAATD
jgi:hypothetical protein